MTPTLPVGGTTGLCHCSSAAIDLAAEWLAMQRQAPPLCFSDIRARFGLDQPDACQALNDARGIAG